MPGHFYGDGVSWLDTGLNNKQLRDIGLITIMWNAAEFDLQELIYVVAGWSPWQSQLVTADMGNVSQVKLALNLLRQGYNHERLMQDVERAIQFFDQCRMRRNALVHGTPVVDDNDKLSGRLARFEAKAGSGKVKVSHINASNTFLEEMIADVWLCRMALTDAYHKVTRFRRHARGKALPLAPEVEAKIFDYSDAPLDIEHLQTRLGLLRSQPPSESKHIGPP